MFPSDSLVLGENQGIGNINHLGVDPNNEMPAQVSLFVLENFVGCYFNSARPGHVRNSRLFTGFTNVKPAGWYGREVTQVELIGHHRSLIHLCRLLQ